MSKKKKNKKENETQNNAFLNSLNQNYILNKQINK